MCCASWPVAGAVQQVDKSKSDLLQEESKLGEDVDYSFEKYGDNLNATRFFETKEIKISAQEYLEKFYLDLGFEFRGERYIEDGIPHCAMYYNK